MSALTRDEVTRRVPLMYGADRGPVVCNVLRWHNVAIADFDRVRWHDLEFTVWTDREKTHSNDWQTHPDTRHFVAHLLADKPSPDELAGEYGQARLVGRLDALWVNTDGELFAEICTGTVDAFIVGSKPSPLFRGRPLPYRYLQCAVNRNIAISYRLHTMRLPNLVGHVSQLVHIETHHIDDDNIDLDVWGEVLQ